MISTSENPTKYCQYVSLRKSDPDALMKISREGLLSLSLEEMKAIQAYFQKQDRDPTDVELESLAQTWSEHCKHKTFKAAFQYEEEDTEGVTPLSPDQPKHFADLLKDTIVQATQELSPSWCLSVFKDNAGVIEFDGSHAVSFKVETHNHPSALEPYGGAGTGIGGVIRDIMGCGLGGKPVLNTDVFCFGPLKTPDSELPTGVLSPKKIARGVVSGVRDYGNRMGIPTANGSIFFDPGYIGNPLVYCGTVGFMPKSGVEKKVEPGDLVVVMGGRTGRDGIHGATFSSAPLEKGITSNVVQIGHAIMEKKTLDVLLAARDKGLYRSITDCGAGGFSSAIGELGAETGVVVNLEKAPLKYPGLKPWEIWVSESQERMVCAVPPDKWNSLKVLFDQEDVEVVAVGEFTDDRTLTVKYENETVAHLDMDFLHDGIPPLQLKALWNSAEQKRQFRDPSMAVVSPEKKIPPEQMGDTLKTLLGHPIIASKEPVIRQYDHEVQGGSVIKPLMGPEFDGPTDACVFRPKLDSWQGVVVSNGMSIEMGKWDPYLMAQYAIDEAYRNLLAVGGHLSHVAILDNFCWGDAKNPYELGGLVRAAEGCRQMALAYQLPFISGKDSFNNTWKTSDGTLRSIPPTLLISAIGIIKDSQKCVTPGIKSSDSLLYVIGETRELMKGSLAGVLWGDEAGELAELDPRKTLPLYQKIQTAFKAGLILACHDVSEGGILVSLAEMAFGGAFGIDINLPDSVKDNGRFLFSETPGRFVVEVARPFQTEFENIMGGWGVQILGQPSKKQEITVSRNGSLLLNESVSVLKQLWKSSLSHI